jgi:hypothetical protein
VKVGYITQNVQAERASTLISGLTVEAALRWLPRTYTTDEVVALYAPTQSSGNGAFNHRYEDRGAVGALLEEFIFITRVLATYVDSDYQNHIAHSDRVSRVGVGAYFDIRSWLRLGAELSHENRNSTG